jgi:hypothetical protein
MQQLKGAYAAQLQEICFIPHRQSHESVEIGVEEGEVHLVVRGSVQISDDGELSSRNIYFGHIVLVPRIRQRNEEILIVSCDHSLSMIIVVNKRC